jgi:hypothetical protein
MRWLAVVVLLPALAFPAVADAQSSEILQVLSPDGARGWSVPLQVSGVVSVDFHGDRGAGCEQAGLCDVSGNETWDPGSRGELLAFGRRRPEGALLVFGADPISDGGSTTARVERTGPDGSTHTCADVASARGGGDLQASHGGFDVRLTGTGGDPFSDSSLLGTRCAGPVDADVRDLLPAGHLSAEQLAMGNARVDLTGERSFASHGLAGTVQSTVVLTLGASVRQHQGKQPPSAVRHVKLVTVTYAIESARGQVSARFGGLSQPELCEQLDACGLVAQATVSINASGGRADLSAFGSARLSRRQLLATLGLVRTSRPPKLRGVGSGFWRGGSTLTTTQSRSGVAACNDTAPLSAGGLILSEAGQRLVARYSVGLDGAAGGLATRCQGPAIEDLSADGVLARGSMPASVLRRRRVTLRLRRGAPFSGQGYAGTSTADVTVVLRRRRIRVTRFDEPGPPRDGGGTSFVDTLVFAPSRR